MIEDTLFSVYVDFNIDNTKKRLLSAFRHPLDKKLTIVVYGENYFPPRNINNPILLSVFMAVNGTIEYGIENYLFFSIKEVDDFLDNLPRMSALEILFKSIGIKPCIN